MANAYATPKVYANVGLAFLKNNLVMANLIDSESVNKQFVPGVGTTVYVKRPPEFIVRSGATASVQDVVEGEVAVTIDQQKGVDVQFTSFEATTNVDQLLKSKVINGAMSQIASQIDADLITRVNEFHNWVGTPGNTVSTVAGYFAAPQRMDELAIPVTDRNAILTPNDGYAMAGTLLSNAAQVGDVARSALMKAKIPVMGNMEAFITQTVPSLTTGTRVSAATSLINGAAQNVTYASCRTTYTQSLITDGQVSKTYKSGEIFTIAGVNAVNPRTKQDLGYLRQFVIIGDVTSDGSGNATFTISPPIITTGAYQTVTAAPADNAAMTWLGALSTTYRQNAGFHKSSIKLVTVQGNMPFTGEAAYATDPDTGLSVRYWRYSDGTNDLHNHRWDVFYGTANIDRRAGVRFSGA